MSETISWKRVSSTRVEAHLPVDLHISVEQIHGDWFWNLTLDYTPNRYTGASFCGLTETEELAKDAALRAAGLVQQIQAIEVGGDQWHSK